MLVEKYGADQLLQEGISKKKLATLIGAGIIAGTSLTDLPRNCNSDKEQLKTEYSNPYGINDVDYENILNKQRQYMGINTITVLQTIVLTRK